MIDNCVCCGSDAIAMQPVLWKELTDAWCLSSDEIAYIDRQQGLHCTRCGTNYRSMALASAIMCSYQFVGLFEDFVRTADAQQLHVLELNEAGGLTQYLARMPGRILGTYPDVDMMLLPYDDNSFDLVVHSDTLEHVPHPVRGLEETRRVLKEHGICAFTIPIIVGRLSRSRAGLPLIYHGNASDAASDFVVHTEFGSDAWQYAIQAGFTRCEIHALEYPTTMAFIGRV